MNLSIRPTNFAFAGKKDLPKGNLPKKQSRFEPTGLTSDKAFDNLKHEPVNRYIYPYEPKLMHPFIKSSESIGSNYGKTDVFGRGDEKHESSNPVELEKLCALASSRGLSVGGKKELTVGDLLAFKYVDALAKGDSRGAESLDETIRKGLRKGDEENISKTPAFLLKDPIDKLVIPSDEGASVSPEEKYQTPSGYYLNGLSSLRTGGLHPICKNGLPEEDPQKAEEPERLLEELKSTFGKDEYTPDETEGVGLGGINERIYRTDMFGEFDKIQVAPKDLKIIKKYRADETEDAGKTPYEIAQELLEEPAGSDSGEAEKAKEILKTIEKYRADETEDAGKTPYEIAQELLKEAEDNGDYEAAESIREMMKIQEESGLMPSMQIHQG